MKTPFDPVNVSAHGAAHPERWQEKMMIHDFDILRWLTEHSTSIRENKHEITFTNVSDTTSSLIKPDEESDLIKISNPNISNFYSEFLGGHFDDSQLIIPTVIKGGFQINNEWHLPDIIEARAQALELGVKIPESEDIIIIEAGWMFFHTISNSTPATIKVYDRDYETVSEEQSIHSIFDNSWDILEADL
ncbi:hypothetical protein P4C99_21675 [Pontiellaceae bacterium B1224]|nr:hypothetical protein [Pontiellaceae bacterium B1224]